MENISGLKKITLIIIFTLCLKNVLPAIEKPIVRTGLNSFGFYTLDKGNEIYPSTLKDNLFAVFEERFVSFFKFRHRTDFFYTNYNKYSDDLENLRSVILHNSLYFYFNPNSRNEFLFLSKPMGYYIYGEKYFKLMSKINYKLKLDNFLFNLGYSNQYAFKENELFYHGLTSSFFWSPKKSSFLKFKSYISVYFNHGVNDSSKKVFPVKSAHINFEIALDFNKMDFERFFDKKEENEFFEEEQIP